MIRQALIALTITWSLTGLSVAEATTATPLTMKSSITVVGDTVSLADLLDGGAAPSQKLFLAPAPGQTGTIQAGRVVSAARKAGLSNIQTNGIAEITVMRTARHLGKGEIETALQQAIVRKSGLEKPEIIFELPGDTTELLIEEDAINAPNISALSVDLRSLRFDAVLTVQGSASLTHTPLHLVGQIVDTIEVPVTTRTLAKGDILASTDIRLDHRPRNVIADMNIIKLPTLIGMAAKDDLPAGSVVSEGAVTKPILVEKGTPVTVVYETSGLTLSMRGKASDSGALGETVGILNLQSKRVIFGTVTGPGRVTASFSDATPVASNTRTSSVQ